MRLINREVGGSNPPGPTLKMNYLFVCTYNVNRSVAASKVFETLLKKYKINGKVRNAGVSELARSKITKELIDWADKIYVMENFHKDILVKMQPNSKGKIEVLGIQDLYGVNDPNLINILKRKLLEEIRNE